MKTLFIVRHAKSSWDYPELDDFERPLNNRGKKNAPEMGKRLAKRNVRPDLFISSPAKRALTTAKRIANEIGYPKKNIQLEPLFYHGSVQNMIDVLKKTDDSIQTLMIFGHNPGLTDLANSLSDSDIYNIPTCGVVEIEFNANSWNQINKETGKLLSFDYPKKNQLH